MSGVGRLHDPDVLLAVVLLELLVVFIEFAKLIWEDVSVWHEVEVLFAISFLHPDNVEAKSVFPRDLMTLREVVDLLILVQSFVEVALATGGAPENIPLMRFC